MGVFSGISIGFMYMYILGLCMYIWELSMGMIDGIFLGLWHGLLLVIAFKACIPLILVINAVLIPFSWVYNRLTTGFLGHGCWG